MLLVGWDSQNVEYYMLAALIGLSIISLKALNLLQFAVPLYESYLNLNANVIWNRESRFRRVPIKNDLS